MTISIYLGDQLNEVIENIEKGENNSKHKAGVMQIGVDTLPNLPKDATTVIPASVADFTAESSVLNSSITAGKILLRTIFNQLTGIEQVLLHLLAINLNLGHQAQASHVLVQ